MAFVLSVATLGDDLFECLMEKTRREDQRLISIVCKPAMKDGTRSDLIRSANVMLCVVHQIIPLCKKAVVKNHRSSVPFS